MRVVLLLLFTLCGFLTACDDECTLSRVRCDGNEIQQCKNDDHLGIGGGWGSDPTEHTSWEAIFLCPEGSSCDTGVMKCISDEPRPECEALPNQSGRTCIGNWKATCVDGHWDMTQGELGTSAEGTTGECPPDYLCVVPEENPQEVICALDGEPVAVCEGAEAEGTGTYSRCLGEDTRVECFMGYQIGAEDCSACEALADGTICCADSLLVACP
ncbi:MAG: hypothetical protein CMH54_08410 [Myxococcales bacterium]|nr:hypothetical protein [Myxococcales bacterium]